MKTLSLSEAKMKLSELVDKVQRLDEEVVITRNGRPAAVLINPYELDSLRETLQIKADCDFMQEIHAGIRALKGKTKIYTLEELLD